MRIRTLRMLCFALPGLQLTDAKLPPSPPSAQNGAAPRMGEPYPTRELAGVDIVDTLVVRDAEAYARLHSSDWLYGHVMRSLLLGALLLRHNATLAAAVDAETHAVAALLHDLGWARDGSSIVSADRRFEVDGAIAAREFLAGRSGWDEAESPGRVQLVWDAIALHTERSIAYYKEPAVQVVSRGIAMDFAGPSMGVTEAEYAAVVEAFPKEGLKDGVNGTFLWLCQTKPATTYGKFGSPSTLLLLLDTQVI